MSFDRAAIGFRKSAPSDETHDLVAVEQEYGSAVAAQRAGNGVERGLVDLLMRGGALQLLGKIDQRPLLLDAPGERDVRERVMQRRCVVEAVDGADHPAVAVLDRPYVHHRPNGRAVRALNATFDTVDGITGAQHCRHRRLGARNRASVEVELIRAAIQLALVANGRNAPPQFGGATVEPEDAPCGIAGIHRDGQEIDEIGSGDEVGPPLHARQTAVSDNA